VRYSGYQSAIWITYREQRSSWPICFCNEIEADRLEELRERYRRHNLRPPSYTALVVKAIARGIAEIQPEFPEINSMLTGFLGWKTIHTFKRISAGVAISRAENGRDLGYQSVLQDPEKTPLTEISRRLQEHATAPAKDVAYMRNCHYLFRAPRPVQEVMLWMGRTFPELRRKYRGTFCLTSVGKFGVDFQLTLPQAACLQFGFGSIRDRAVVRHGQVIAAPTFYLSMSFDRRLMNGKPCSILLERIRDILNAAAFADEPDLEALQAQATRGPSSDSLPAQRAAIPSAAALTSLPYPEPGGSPAPC
jgi:hypothetical protein